MKFLLPLMLLASLVACSSRSSDEEQVRELIDAVEAAAEARDASDVLAFVADDYADAGGYDKSGLRDFLRAYFLMHPKLELLVNISRLEFPADGLAQAEVTVTTVELSDPDRVTLDVEFRRIDGEWRVVRTERRQP